MSETPSAVDTVERQYTVTVACRKTYFQVQIQTEGTANARNEFECSSAYITKAISELILHFFGRKGAFAVTVLDVQGAVFFVSVAERHSDQLRAVLCAPLQSGEATHRFRILGSSCFLAALAATSCALVQA